MTDKDKDSFKKEIARAAALVPLEEIAKAVKSFSKRVEKVEKAKGASIRK